MGAENFTRSYTQKKSYGQQMAAQTGRINVLLRKSLMIGHPGGFEMDLAMSFSQNCGVSLAISPWLGKSWTLLEPVIIVL